MAIKESINDNAALPPLQSSLPVLVYWKGFNASFTTVNHSHSPEMRGNSFWGQKCSKVSQNMRAQIDFTLS